MAPGLSRPPAVGRRCESASKDPRCAFELGYTRIRTAVRRVLRDQGVRYVLCVSLTKGTHVDRRLLKRLFNDFSPRVCRFVLGPRSLWTLGGQEQQVGYR